MRRTRAANHDLAPEVPSRAAPLIPFAPGGASTFNRRLRCWLPAWGHCGGGPKGGRTLNDPQRHRHAEFVTFYELYLHLAYQLIGRAQLARAIGRELRTRGIETVLDCAAGTGFPSLDLASEQAGPFTIHCCDADPQMLIVFCENAKDVGLDVTTLIPPRRSRSWTHHVADELEVRWSDLDQLRIEYDLVMCRGNSLAYADSWSGDDDVAPLEKIRSYLADMLRRVRPGGYLMVDAPWQLGLDRSSRSNSIGGWSYREEVERRAERREWRVQVIREDRDELLFRRFSSLLTIRQIEEILIDLGAEETDPVRLEGERTNFGTIIARKPT